MCHSYLQCINNLKFYTKLQIQAMMTRKDRRTDVQRISVLRSVIGQDIMKQECATIQKMSRF